MAEKKPTERKASKALPRNTAATANAASANSGGGRAGARKSAAEASGQKAGPSKGAKAPARTRAAKGAAPAATGAAKPRAAAKARKGAASTTAKPKVAASKAKSATPKAAAAKPLAKAGTKAKSQSSENVVVRAAELEAFQQAHRDRFAAQQQELSDLRDLLAQRDQLAALQATAIDDLEAKRLAAEAQRSGLSIVLRQVNDSLVWRYAGVFRMFGRRLPRVAGLAALGFEALHQLFTGKLAKRMERRAKRKAILDEDRAAILASDLFDPNWYVARYPDVADYEGGALEHFLRFGAVENRSPNAIFDIAWYQAAYPEVVASGRNPLAYYALFGIAQKHAASPAFDTHWYAVHNKDHLTTGLTPLQHFIHAGQVLGLPTQASAAAREFAYQRVGKSVVVPPEPEMPRLGPAGESDGAAAKAGSNPVVAPSANGAQPSPADSSALPAPAVQPSPPPLAIKRKPTLAVDGPKIVHAQQAHIFSRRS